MGPLVLPPDEGDGAGLECRQQTRAMNTPMPAQVASRSRACWGVYFRPRRPAGLPGLRGAGGRAGGKVARLVP